MKWYGIEKGRFWFVERMLMWKAKSLYKFCRKHKLNYTEIYFLDSDGIATANFRAKRDVEVVANGYAFVKAESKKE